MIKVFKFGGASVKDAEGIRNVAHILRTVSTNENIVLIVSAIGKTTNELEELAKAYFENKTTKHLLSAIKAKHEQIAQTLFPNSAHPIHNAIHNLFEEINWILEETPKSNFDFEYDQIVSMGELLSSTILFHHLKEQLSNVSYLDSRNIIRTNNHYRSAKVDWKESQALCNDELLPQIQQKKQHIWVSQGFIGATSENFNTTLGREGSDYSAAIFAHLLNAHSVSIWKDVPGVLNADPRFFAHTQVLPFLSFDQAAELAYAGASVIHPKTLKPLQQKNIPLLVKSFKDPLAAGTCIQNQITPDLIPCLVLKKNASWLKITNLDASFIEEKELSIIFSLFHQNLAKVLLMENTTHGFFVALSIDPWQFNQLLRSIEQQFSCTSTPNVDFLVIHAYTPALVEQHTQGKKILWEKKNTTTVQLLIQQ